MIYKPDRMIMFSNNGIHTSTQLVISWFSFAGDTIGCPSKVYVIPLQTSESVSKVPLILNSAWEKLSENNGKNENNFGNEKSSFDGGQVKKQKCSICSRRHKIGVNGPKCCESRLAQDHLFAHLFDEILLESNSCTCSINTLAEILPKLGYNSQGSDVNAESSLRR